MPQSKWQELNNILGEMQALYHQIAHEIGISDSTFDILYTLATEERDYTQSDICKITGANRQTINSAIRKLERDEILYLVPQNKKSMRICLTEKGNAYLKEKIEPIIAMENTVYEEWSEDDVNRCIYLARKYCKDLEREHRLNSVFGKERT